MTKLKAPQTTLSSTLINENSSSSSSSGSCGGGGGASGNKQKFNRQNNHDSSQHNQRHHSSLINKSSSSSIKQNNHHHYQQQQQKFLCNSSSSTSQNNSNSSSNETVIARLDCSTTSLTSSNNTNNTSDCLLASTLSGGAKNQLSSRLPDEVVATDAQSLLLSGSISVPLKTSDDASETLQNDTIVTTTNTSSCDQKQRTNNNSKKLVKEYDQPANSSNHHQQQQQQQSRRNKTLRNILHLAGQHLNVRLTLARRYLSFGLLSGSETNNNNNSIKTTQSAPVTPIHKCTQQQQQQQQQQNGFVITRNSAFTQTGNSLDLINPSNGAANAQLDQLERTTTTTTSVLTAAAPPKPSVRFVESEDGGANQSELNESDETVESELSYVTRLFEVAPAAAPTTTSSKPMDSQEFRKNGYKLIDYICNYLDTIERRRVTPVNIEPGYLKSLIERQAPQQAESFGKIMLDFESKIMPGITHWQHPHFHAYFPAGNAYPSILADMLGDALGCVGFSWAASPAYTELEQIMLDWMGRMIGLPEEFLCGCSSAASSMQTPPPPPPPVDGTSSGGGTNNAGGVPVSRGGGVIQGSASECVLVNLLAARHWTMQKLRKKYPSTPDGLLLSKLIGYCSKEAHSCVEKAAMIGFIRMRALDTDERHSLRGPTLKRAIEQDKLAGLEPFIVCATLGTTSCVSFDNLRELGEICRQEDDLWLHVDAAYAGSALICPEFKYLMDGIELASSFNMNPNKWLLINFDCSLMWVKDRFKLTRAFVVDPLYLQHSYSDQAIDYRHWGVPLSRRFRALKLWFTIRNYGISGLQAYIRNHCKLAKLFESLIRQDERFIITNEVVLGLVCFRLIGSNALNQRLLSMINASGQLHMVPASLEGRYVIRFCVCARDACEADIRHAYRCIASAATELFAAIRAGRERIRAISQQNTIDVSSISLHTQQSASADRLNSAAAAAAAEQQVAQPDQIKPIQPKSQLVKQATVTTEQLEQQQPVAAAANLSSLASIDGHDFDLELDDDDDDDDDDNEEEIDEVSSLSSFETPQSPQQKNKHNDEEELDSLGGHEEAAAELRSFFVKNKVGTNGAPPQPPSKTAAAALDLHMDCMSPMQRATIDGATAGASATSASNADERNEAADEIVKLVGRRNRMSLRYKREFFVRVVSDPRVYRASISGDINAHQSTGSLVSGGGGGGAGAATTTSNNPTTSSNITMKSSSECKQQQQQQHIASNGAPL